MSCIEAFLAVSINRMVAQRMLEHIDNDITNNHVKNLRWVDYDQPGANSTRLNNTSGFRGVSYSKQSEKYTASIQIGGKTKHLGSFYTAEEAWKAYEAKVKDLHGQFYYNKK